MTDRNFLLELLDGPRTYCPPPGFLLVQCVNADKTKTGFLTPGGKQPPLGLVLAVGNLKAEYEQLGSPAQTRNYVMFIHDLYPGVQIHDGMVMINMDCVSLRIVPGRSKDVGVYHEPEKVEAVS